MPKITLYPTAISRISLSSSTNPTYQNLQPILNKSPSEIKTPVKLIPAKGAYIYTNIIFSMDWSAIPANAIITKMSLTTKGQATEDTYPLKMSQSALYISECIPSSIDKNIWGLPWGADDTAKITFSAKLTNETIYYTPTPTRAQLDNLQVIYFAARGIVSSHEYFVNFYGFQVDIEYTLPEEVKIKINNVWVTSSNFYKKEKGVWVKQTNTKTLFDPNVYYQHQQT